MNTLQQYLQSEGYCIGRGVYVDLNPYNPRIVTEKGELPIRRATLNLITEGRERIFFYADGKAIDNTGIITDEPPNESVYGAVLGREDVVSEKGEPVNLGVSLYLPLGNEMAIFSSTHPDKATGFAALYAETDYYCLAVTTGRDANGIPVIFWEITGDSNRMGIYRSYAQALAQLTAKHNKPTIRYWIHEEPQGGCRDELDG